MDGLTNNDIATASQMRDSYAISGALSGNAGIRAKVDCNGDKIDTGNIINRIDASAAERSLSDQVARGNEFLTDRINGQSALFSNQNILNAIESSRKQESDNARSAAVELCKCCGDLKAEIAAVRSEVSTNRQVAEAYRDGGTQAKLDALLASNGHGHGGQGN